MGVIVFMIGPGSSELDGFLAVNEMAQEMSVKEFRAAIGVKAEEGKRQKVFDVTDLG